MPDARDSAVNKINIISALNGGYRCVCVCVCVQRLYCA